MFLFVILSFAKSFTNITEEHEKIILHARKTLVFTHGKRLKPNTGP